VHNFWAVYYREDNRYHYELNVTKNKCRKISNFFYHTRLQVPKKAEYDKYRTRHNTWVNKPKYKPVFLYFFNKICLNNYPYLYWQYSPAYNAYGTEVPEQHINKNLSHHVRAYNLVLFLQCIKKSKLKARKISFYKFALETFFGTRKFFSIRKKKQQTYKKKKIQQVITREPFEFKSTIEYLVALRETTDFFFNKFLDTRPEPLIINLIKRVRFLIDLKNTEALIIKSTDYSTKKYTLS
jgi:uncharacterized protein YqfB (UPF0267 family)